jgi:hypothetical protein
LDGPSRTGWGYDYDFFRIYMARKSILDRIILQLVLTTTTNNIFSWRLKNIKSEKVTTNGSSWWCGWEKKRIRFLTLIVVTYSYSYQFLPLCLVPFFHRNDRMSTPIFFFFLPCCCYYYLSFFCNVGEVENFGIFALSNNICCLVIVLVCLWDSRKYMEVKKKLSEGGIILLFDHCSWLLPYLRKRNVRPIMIHSLFFGIEGK